MTIWTLILILAVLLSGCALGVFITLLAGIRSEERHMSLSAQPGTRAGLATRRVLSVYVRHDIAEYEDARR